MTEYAGNAILFDTVTESWSEVSVFAYDDDPNYLPTSEIDLPASTFYSVGGALIPLGSAGMGSLTLIYTTVTGGSGWVSTWGVPIDSDTILFFPTSGGTYQGQPLSNISEFEIIVPITASSAVLSYGRLGMTAISENDVFVGDAGENEIDAGPGDDNVAGRAGRDRLFGQDGEDTLLGQAGRDRLSGGSDDDRLKGGAGNDTLSGGTGNDTLNGGGGNDEMFGQSGADTLVGGNGDDLQYGGGGSDTFVYRDLNEGDDTIGDFVRGTDVIDLSAVASGFGQLTIQTGALGVEVQFGTSSITLNNIFQVDASDFLF